MCYLLNALSCTDWHIWKKLRKYIFMFTRLKVVPTIKIGAHTGPLCHVKNVTFWKFSWYCEKTRWKALYFYMINMICMMCVFIWIFTQLHFYLIDDSYVGQKYGIEFSCQFRCRNMSCETTWRYLGFPYHVTVSSSFSAQYFAWISIHIPEGMDDPMKHETSARCRASRSVKQSRNEYRIQNTESLLLPWHTLSCNQRYYNNKVLPHKQATQRHFSISIHYTWLLIM